MFKAFDNGAHSRAGVDHLVRMTPLLHMTHCVRMCHHVSGCVFMCQACEGVCCFIPAMEGITASPWVLRQTHQRRKASYQTFHCLPCSLLFVLRPISPCCSLFHFPWRVILTLCSKLWSLCRDDNQILCIVLYPDVRHAAGLRLPACGLHPPGSQHSCPHWSTP